MARRLIAAIVPLVLGITPSLALACDARCLAEPATRTSFADRTGHTHDHHSSAHWQAAPAHAHHTQVAQSSDAVSPVHVSTLVTAAGSAHHGCKAAFDEGTVNRQSV